MDVDSNVSGVDIALKLYAAEAQRQFDRQMSDLDILDEKLRDVNSTSGLIASIATAIIGAAVTAIYTTASSPHLTFHPISAIFLIVSAAAYCALSLVTASGLKPAEYTTVFPDTWDEIDSQLTQWDNYFNENGQDVSKREFDKSVVKLYQTAISSNKRIVQIKKDKIVYAGWLMRAMSATLILSTILLAWTNAR